MNNLSIITPKEIVSADTSNEVEFDIERGACYLWCCWSLISECTCLPFYCIARNYMTSQRVIMDDRRINYKSDCCIIKTDKMVPYDRIQDVNITENCCHRLWGVADVSIQTAGGGSKPEIIITAPKDPHMLRDRIISRRDAVVHGTSDGTSGSAVSTATPLLSDNAATIRMHETLLRIEHLMDRGLEKLNK